MTVVSLTSPCRGHSGGQLTAGTMKPWGTKISFAFMEESSLGAVVLQ